MFFIYKLLKIKVSLKKGKNIMIQKSLGSKSKEISLRETEHLDLSRMVGNEGVVLLKNDDVLPLKGKSVALFGNGVRKPIKCGTGSGDVNVRGVDSVEKAFESMGINVETKAYLDDFDNYFDNEYEKWLSKSKKAIDGVDDIIKIVHIVVDIPFRYPTAIHIEDKHLKNLSTDTAIYIISRQAGEGNDRKVEEGDYLLTSTELDNLKVLNQRFKNVVLVLNTGSVIDMNFLDQYPNINAVLYVGQPGQAVGCIIAETLMGISNPSGKLTATWAFKYEDYPNADTFSYLSGSTLEEDYIEDIYVGYRYFDSINKPVRYPFGYGLSYTTFEYKNQEFSIDGSQVTVCVDVKNSGLVPGKEVVQIYVSLPPSRINHEYQRLVAFGKTPLLQPNETTTLKLSFNIEERCAVYYENISSYILLGGEYTLRCGKNSLDTSAVGNFVLNKDMIIEECTPICPTERKFDTISVENKAVESEAKVAKITVKDIDVPKKKNLYNQDILFRGIKYRELLSKLEAEELAELVVGAGVRSEAMVQVPASTSTTSKLYDSHGIPSVVVCDGPAGLKVTPETVELKNGKLAPINLASRKGNWMDLVSEKVPVFTEEAGIPHYFFATAWPGATVQAQTWNVELLEDIGKAVSKEMIEFGITTWLAPGMNIQRNPLCGRNFEYYSEDPVVSGLMAAAITRGVQSNPHTSVTIKHFVANNQEDNRKYSNSNLSERALREIYLKGFEIAVKLSQPKALMSSYNLINGVYSPNSYDLLTKVLRFEWGFEGMVMTDWSSCEEDRGDSAKAIQAGNDLIMPGRPENKDAIIRAIKSNDLDLKYLQLSADRVLQLIATNKVFPFGL
jgi:beta-glucosidase